MNLYLGLGLFNCITCRVEPTRAPPGFRMYSHCSATHKILVREQLVQTLDLMVENNLVEKPTHPSEYRKCGI